MHTRGQLTPSGSWGLGAETPRRPNHPHHVEPPVRDGSYRMRVRRGYMYAANLQRPAGSFHFYHFVPMVFRPRYRASLGPGLRVSACTADALKIHTCTILH